MDEEVTGYLRPALWCPPGFRAGPARDEVRDHERNVFRDYGSGSRTSHRFVNGAVDEEMLEGGKTESDEPLAWSVLVILMRELGLEDFWSRCTVRTRRSSLSVKWA